MSSRPQKREAAALGRGATVPAMTREWSSPDWDAGYHQAIRDVVEALREFYIENTVCSDFKKAIDLIEQRFGSPEVEEKYRGLAGKLGEDEPSGIWECQIGEASRAKLPHGADAPMRRAVREAYTALTGEEPEFIFSGWGSELSETRRAVVEDDGG